MRSPGSRSLWLVILVAASSLVLFFSEKTRTRTRSSFTSTPMTTRRRIQQTAEQSASATTTTTTGPASPVIGILSQPLHSNDTTTRGNDDYDYIAASYVKWLEVGGARSIPIPYNAPPGPLLDDLLGQINGFLLPGGSATMPPSVIYLLDKIVQSNNQGRYFPVWGTCLGFEFLVAYAGGGENDDNDAVVQSGFDAENVSLALESVRVRQLYQDPVTFETVQTRNVTMNNHQRGVEPDRFVQNDKLSLLWDVTSINHDKSGRPFVSTMEPMDPDRFPIYGVQYHPEKNAFEFATYPETNIPYEAIDHSPEGVAFSAYTARFFVDRARRSLAENPFHAYTKPQRYPLVGTYPVRTGLGFEQVYVIPDASHWSNGATVKVETER